MVFNQSRETPITIVKCTIARGRTKKAKARSIVFVQQHGGDDVTCKPPIERVVYELTKNIYFQSDSISVQIEIIVNVVPILFLALALLQKSFRKFHRL